MIGRQVRDWWQQTFASSPPLHAVDRRLATRWIKRRLVALYPELRDDPRALEEAYRALNLEPREGTGPGDAPTVFHLRLPSI